MTGALAQHLDRATILKAFLLSKVGNAFKIAAIYVQGPRTQGDWGAPLEFGIWDLLSKILKIC